ncbi:alpha-galactosidase [Yoonia sediminilitoris]|uniref:alpha-galactosidase n=1 Tax=Yoonia sediminilitoris TaxID=1286148 RepID=A0A2T6KIV6_9RHOB|nr:alpha-galactosidase [Yoonia sediminilitoris]PUB15649.1 alpha-galactosidase [Yoonia sediminilitoris]RCW96258.1 alpha-galactosidase [Yoonia sediminilitoris]
MIYRLDDKTQTLLLAPTDGLPAVVYFGPRLPAAEDLDQVAAAHVMDLTGGMLDALAPLTICPLGDGVYQGQPALLLADIAGAEIIPAFASARIEIADKTATVIARDATLGLTYRAQITLDGVLTLQAMLTSDDPVRLNWLSAPVLPVPGDHSDVMEFAGKWTSEFHLHRQPFSPGARLREGRAGRSGHEVPPFAYTCTHGARFTDGSALAFAYGWPGGHRMIAEELPCGRRLMQFGNAMGAEQGLATQFETATLTIARSDTGLNGCAVQLQAHVRDRLVPWPDPDRPRPVHYNCWEAVYFDHDLAVLSDMAERAARIGAERFVLDDGWFGKRDDDTTSLGDWDIDRRKWPDGLTPLIDKVHAEGMSFGLWVEPEMVNAESDLYRAHPDWILGAPDQVTGRYQLVLDLGRAEVRDYLFGKLDAILSENAIDYLKWDHNRLLPVVDAAQGDGILDLLARLRAAHPTVEIESCASGGGRIDYGILQQTTRVWLSDCIDALERLRMQQAAALVIPSAITGSHVGAFKSHTTGRHIPMAFRSWVAAMRHMGFESDLRDFSPEDEALLSRVTAWYKANRDWMMAGAIHQLDCDDPTVTAEIQIAADGARFVTFVGQAAYTQQILPRPVRLTGLDPDAIYRVTLVNPQDRAAHSRGAPGLMAGPLSLSGRVLMTTGLNLPIAWPATMFVIEGQRIS